MSTRTMFRARGWPLAALVAALAVATVLAVLATSMASAQDAEHDGEVGQFSPTPAAPGVTVTTWGGGGYDALAAALVNGESVWVFVEDEANGYVVGAPDFANAIFLATYPDGLPAGTMAVVARHAVVEDEDDTDPIEIGALLPLTGALASYGETSEALLAEAVAAINEGDGPGVALVTEDTNSDPATALKQLQVLHDRGINVVVGPYSSSEVAEVLDYAEEHGLLLLSPLSTAHDLAIADDILFRFTPDDIEEGIAVASLAWEDGVRSLLLVNRDDLGNTGLAVAVADAFEAMGGEVIDHVAYGTGESDFADLVATMDTALEGSSDAGVYLAAFNEVGDLLATASESPALGEVPWYGSNSVALSGELLQNEAGAAFAMQVDYPNPILGLRDADEAEWGPVVERVGEAIGRNPDAFALAAYDALVVGHGAVAEAGDDAGVAALTEALVSIADASTGLTGPLALNEAGDRALASYDFWGVCERDDGSLSWTRVAFYAGGGDAQRLTDPGC